MEPQEAIAHPLFQSCLAHVKHGKFEEARELVLACAPRGKSFLRGFEKHLSSHLPVDVAESWLLENLAYGGEPSPRFCALEWSFALGEDISYIDVRALQKDGKQDRPSPSARLTGFSHETGIPSVLEGFAQAPDMICETMLELEAAAVDHADDWAETEHAERTISGLSYAGEPLRSGVLYQAWAFVLMSHLVAGLRTRLQRHAQLREVGTVYCLRTYDIAEGRKLIEAWG